MSNDQHNQGQTFGVNAGSRLTIPDTVDLERGRNSGLREAAEFLREESRDYATRAARLGTDHTDVSQELANVYTRISKSLRRCGEILDERAAHGPQEGK